MIPVTRPYIPRRERLIHYLNRIDQSQTLTNFGPLHHELKHKLEEYLGVENLLLVANGTLALQIAYKTLGLTGKVLTTPFTFIATASSIKWEGLEPVFGDIDPETFNLDVRTLPDNPRELGITAIVAVHVYGNPCDVEALQTYARKHNLKLIYDAAHAFGVKLNGQSVLQYGDASALSFHATKIFHTGEGGAIIFKQKEDYERALRLINFGFDDQKNIVDVGINAKMSEYHAAVGLCVLEDIDHILEHRLQQFDYYQKHLSTPFGFQKWHKDSEPNGAYAPIAFPTPQDLKQSNEILQEHRILARRYFYPALNTASLYTKKLDAPLAESLAERILCLPIFSTNEITTTRLVVKLLKNKEN